MKHLLTLLICLTCAAALHGQALRSSGAVPADLQMSVWQLYDSDIQSKSSKPPTISTACWPVATSSTATPSAPSPRA